MNKAKEIPASETLHDLVGRNIMHRFIEENGQYKWYNGTVISQVFLKIKTTTCVCALHKTSFGLTTLCYNIV